MKYKVLWLDDDFESGIGVEDTYRKITLDKEFNETFTITKCSNYDMFKNYLSEDHFDAVILDIYGYTDESTCDKSVNGFTKAIDFIRDKDIITKIYTGDPGELGTKGGLITFIKNDQNLNDKDIFYKSGYYKDLFRCLKDDLEKKMHLYKQHPYIREIIVNNYLGDDSKNYIDQLLESKYNKVSIYNINSANLRSLLQNILESLVYTNTSSRRNYQLISEQKVGTDQGTPGRLGCLARLFWKDKDSIDKTDLDSDEVLELKCITDIIQVLYNACNKFNHSSGNKNSRNLYDAIKYFADEYLEVVYNGFFVLLSWYCNHRKRHS